MIVNNIFEIVLMVSLKSLCISHMPAHAPINSIVLILYSLLIIVVQKKKNLKKSLYSRGL